MGRTPWTHRRSVPESLRGHGKKGYRLTSVSGYESGGGARYAASWTKQSGPAWAARKILKPAGAGGIVIGGDKEVDRKSNEVKYYGSNAYSSVKPKRFDSHGGWIATPIDLLRFMRHETVLSKSYAHYGEMSGTMSVYRRRGDGFGYAATSNTSNDSTEQMNEMLEKIVEGVSTWPSGNLF